jgi:hypothetical protein
MTETTKTISTEETKKLGVLSLNLLIFAGYFLFGVLAVALLPKDYSYLGLVPIVIGHFIHALFLVGIGVVKFIKEKLTETPTKPGAYFLAALCLFTIGFGSCSAFWMIANDLSP